MMGLWDAEPTTSMYHISKTTKKFIAYTMDLQTSALLDLSDRSYGVQNPMDFYFEQAAVHRRPHSLHWALETFWQHTN